MDRAASFDRLRQNDDTLPLNLGQYRLLDEIGRGGMGRVYKALHTIMGRVVAIKVISPELVQDPVAVEWFRREVCAGTQLLHPNIVMAYDANEAEGLHFLVMEYVEGMTLDALVKQHGPLPVDHACALMRQAALGLQHAHEKGMVHRDIKPGNLLIPRSEGDSPSEVLVKILDFGLARLQGKAKGDTIALRGETGVLGTPDYVSPEQSRDIHAADIRSDLYSLGCSFYFALTGCVPFPGDNAMEKLIKHLLEEPEPVEKLRPDVPPALAAIVRRLMAKNPEQRYQTPAELVQELDVWCAGPPQSVPAVRASDRPTWVTPPTHLGVNRPATSEMPECTRIVNNVDVFAPSRRAPESGPSLLEPLCECIPDARDPLRTHDTLPLFPAEETEEVKTAGDAGPTASTEDKTAPLVPSVGGEILPPIDPMVARLWRRWTALIETIVEGGPARVNADAYRTIHSLLSQACRAAVDAAGQSERRAFYEECLSIAQPWLKPQTFAHTEPGMLESLLPRCRQIELELNGGKRPWTLRQIVALLLLAFSPIAAALWYQHFGRRWLPSLLEAFRDGFSLASLRLAWHAVRQHPILTTGAIFPLVALFSIYLLLRKPRT